MDFGMQRSMGTCGSVTSLAPFSGVGMMPGMGMTAPGMGMGAVDPSMSLAAMRCSQGPSMMPGATGMMDPMAQMLMMEQQLLIGMMQLLLGLMMGQWLGRSMAGATGGGGGTSSDSGGVGQIGGSNEGGRTGGAGAGGQTGGAGTSSEAPPSVGAQGDVPVPSGRSGIEKVFGAPGTNIVSMKMPAGPGGKEITVTCNAKIAGKLKAAFEEIKAKGLSHLIHTFDGSYNYRKKRGGSDLSVHSWGVAFDINASENPMGRNTGTAGQQQLAEIFAKYGFHQLGNDRMHFQYATGY